MDDDVTVTIFPASYSDMSETAQILFVKAMPHEWEDGSDFKMIMGGKEVNIYAYFEKLASIVNDCIDARAAEMLVEKVEDVGIQLDYLTTRLVYAVKDFAKEKFGVYVRSADEYR